MLVRVVSRPKAADHPAYSARMAAVPDAPSPAMTLYVAVSKSHYVACNAAGKLDRRLLGGRKYIGLRETVEAAMERAQKVFYPAGVNKETYVILRLRLSADAVATFTTMSAGKEHQFASMLHKKTYWGETDDWRVWHFCGDFPLRFPGVRADWLAIE